MSSGFDRPLQDGNYLKQVTQDDPEETAGRFSEESFT
jgi:hypothetical protein